MSPIFPSPVNEIKAKGRLSITGVRIGKRIGAAMAHARGSHLKNWIKRVWNSGRISNKEVQMIFYHQCRIDPGIVFSMLDLTASLSCSFCLHPLLFWTRTLLVLHRGKNTFACVLKFYAAGQTLDDNFSLGLFLLAWKQIWYIFWDIGEAMASKKDEKITTNGKSWISYLLARISWGEQTKK